MYHMITDCVMCNFYSLIMVFHGYLLFYLIVGKLFSLPNLVCPKMCCNNFENLLTIKKVLPKNNFE